MGRLEKIIGVEIIHTYHGEIRLGHTWHEVNVLEDFILKQKPKNFIEVGIHEGGLSYLLIPNILCNYIGIEIDCSIIRPEVIDVYKKYIRYASLMCFDCFSYVVYDCIKPLKNKIIYCDGGHKAQEIAYFKSILSVGDIIMCHDFYDKTREVRGVPKENISIEVTRDDIQIYEKDTAFERLPEEIFGETRIIGWRKIV
jgi:hypothetical protein